MLNIKPSTLAIHNPLDNSLNKNRNLLFKDAFTCLNFDGKKMPIFKKSFLKTSQCDNLAPLSKEALSKV